MARPTKINRADKIQGIASSLPPNKKYTHIEANEDRDAINDTIDFLHFTLQSDEDGVIDDQMLAGKDIASFIGAGGVFLEGIEGDEENHFSKETAASTITMINDNSIAPNKKYTFFTR